MRNNSKKDKKQNQGFSLFTVLVAVAFAGILSLLVIYISMSNFYMKSTDLKGKDSFYTAEQALEEIRTGLQEDVGEAMSGAYVQVLENYSRNVTSQDVTLDEVRQSEFCELFVKLLSNRLRPVGESRDIYDLEKLDRYLVTKHSGQNERYDDTRESLILTAIDSNNIMKADLKNGVLLKNLKVTYVDESGHASIIETDIRLAIPKVQFPTPSTLPDLMNMIVVADGGIICNGNSVSENMIKGNVYAGLLSESSLQESGIQNPQGMTTSILLEPDAKLSISNGNKAVCQGEISVRERGKFSSAGEVSLWAQGLTLASADVSLLGKTYFSDDLTVENGSGSKVTVRGEYYGYGSQSSAAASYNKDYFQNHSITGGNLSSAIVINGKNTTMDLSGVQKIMLSGKNYVSTSTVNSGDENKQNKDILMGESLSVKGMQLAYLVPSQLLGDGTKTNPMSSDEYTQALIDGSITVDMDRPMEIWNGKSLREIGVDSEHPVQEVFYQNTFGGATDKVTVYFYLNFTDEDKAVDYMKLYYQNYEKNSQKIYTKANMDKYLSFYFGGEGNGIQVNDPTAYTRYITNGNILFYDGEKKEGRLDSASASHVSGSGVGETLLQEQISYQNTWFTLNRKMIGSYDLLNTSVKGKDGTVDHDERVGSRTVFDNLVNEPEMVNFIKDKEPGSLLYNYSASTDDGSLSLIMVHNGEPVGGRNTPLIINGTSVSLGNGTLEVPNLRLVVCTGDVVIKSDVEFKGIIMAKGKITMEPGAKLFSDSLGASKVFQANMNQMASNPDDKVSAQDFFWEGEKYVLGNSTATGGESTKTKISNVYDLADCVTYENWKKR